MFLDQSTTRTYSHLGVKSTLTLAQHSYSMTSYFLLTFLSQMLTIPVSSLKSKSSRNSLSHSLLHPSLVGVLIAVFSSHAFHWFYSWPDPKMCKMLATNSVVEFLKSYLVCQENAKRSKLWIGAAMRAEQVLTWHQEFISMLWLFFRSTQWGCHLRILSLFPLHLDSSSHLTNLLSFVQLWDVRRRVI